MFNSIKKIIFYSTVIAVPFGLVALILKYFFYKDGKDTNIEDITSEAVAFFKKLVDFFKKIKK